MGKEIYQKPEIEIIEVEIEGVLALSWGDGGPNNPGWGQLDNNHDDIFKNTKA